MALNVNMIAISVVLSRLRRLHGVHQELDLVPAFRRRLRAEEHEGARRQERHLRLRKGKKVLSII